MKDKTVLRNCISCGRPNWHMNDRCAWCGSRLQTHAEKFMGYAIGVFSVVVTIVVVIWLGDML